MKSDNQFFRIYSIRPPIISLSHIRADTSSPSTSMLLVFKKLGKHFVHSGCLRLFPKSFSISNQLLFRNSSLNLKLMPKDIGVSRDESRKRTLFSRHENSCGSTGLYTMNADFTISTWIFSGMIFASDENHQMVKRGRPTHYEERLAPYIYRDLNELSNSLFGSSTYLRSGRL